MKKTLFVGLALSSFLTVTSAAFAADVNLDAPYGDRAPGGYQHLTTHYHNYWRDHHHPWSNIERERQIVKEAQDFDDLTKVYEGRSRSTFVRATDEEVRAKFAEYVWNAQKSDFNTELPVYFAEQVKNRPSVDTYLKESLKLHAFLPQPLSYNDITYMPDEFTREKLDMPDQRFRSGLLGNDMILYDVVTGRVRGIWKDIIN